MHTAQNLSTIRGYDSMGKPLWHEIQDPKRWKVLNKYPITADEQIDLHNTLWGLDKSKKL